MQTLAAKINRLFEVMHRKGELPMSTAAAANGILTQTGAAISPAYLDQLRSGTVTEPSAPDLTAIAQFFGVPTEYLTEGRPDIERQLSLLEQMRDASRVFACRRQGS